MIEIIEVGMYAFFEALSIILCLHFLYGEKFRFDTISICYLLIDVTIMEISYLLQLKSIWTLIIFPIIFLYCGFRFRFTWKPLIINNLLQTILLTALQATIMIIYSTISNKNKLNETDAVIVTGIMFLVVFYGFKRCKLKKISDALQSDEGIVMASLTIIIVAIILFLLNYKQNRQVELLYYAVLGISIVMIVVTVIDIGRNKIRVKEAEAELRLHKLYETSFRELIDEICARQHEFDNHINTIYSQHRLYKNYEELVEAQRKYCGEIVEENHYNKILSKGNPVIICFLYSQLSEMDKKGIAVTYKISIDDLECKMPVYKMVELLGNLIKNAMEAVQSKDEGKIHVTMIEKNDMIQIEVLNVNRVVEEKEIRDFFKKGYSEKGKRRGYGLYNVKRICEEYGAAIMCKNIEKEGKNWIMFSVIICKDQSR